MARWRARARDPGAPWPRLRCTTTRRRATTRRRRSSRGNAPSRTQQVPAV